MSLSLFDLSGRRALVTGSGQGIGFALAEGLAQRRGSGGAQRSRSRRSSKPRQGGCKRQGSAPLSRPLMLAIPCRWPRASPEIEAEQGPIDILVNNAGIQRRAPLEEFGIETWHELMRANLDSVFYVGQAVARRMIPRGRGKIINIASLQSEAARYSIAPYTAAKGAVKNLTKGMCTDWARHGLQINAIGPGYFATPLNQALIDDPEFDAWLKNRTPARRWGRVEELVGACIFLASAASDFVNGQTLYVDGGVLATL